MIDHQPDRIGRQRLTGRLIYLRCQPVVVSLVLSFLLFNLAGCAGVIGLSAATGTTAATPAAAEPSIEPTAASTLPPSPAPSVITLSAQPDASAAPSTSAGQSTRPVPTGDRLAGYVVVLDPGHQQKANLDLEPIAPGSADLKRKCSSGTAGVATRRPEYVVDLEISMLLQDFLVAQGCQVYLTRTTHAVDLSNIDRAKIALAYDPDVYIRMHCNGSTDPAQTGTSVYVAKSGRYVSQLPAWGRLLAGSICGQTGGRNRGCVANNSYTGLNWATDIPAFLLEMGYMTNPEEDRRLSDPAYQQEICQGIVDFTAQMPIR